MSTERLTAALEALEKEEAALAAIRPGDVVMVKGSNGSRISRIVTAIEEKFAAKSAD